MTVDCNMDIIRENNGIENLILVMATLSRNTISPKTGVNDIENNNITFLNI